MVLGFCILTILTMGRETKIRFQSGETKEHRSKQRSTLEKTKSTPSSARVVKGGGGGEKFCSGVDISCGCSCCSLCLLHANCRFGGEVVLFCRKGVG